MSGGLTYDFGESPGFWICSTKRMVERALARELAPLGVTPKCLEALFWVTTRGKLSQVELAELMQIEAATLVGLLKRMERDGWVLRGRCVADRRRRLVEALPISPQLGEALSACYRRVMERATLGIPPTELAHFQAMLAQIRRNVSEYRGGGSGKDVPNSVTGHAWMKAD